MAKYLVKTAEQRLLEVKSTAQLERLVLTGLVARDALVRTLPDGPWMRGEKHPDTAGFFKADEHERTMIAVSPALLRRPSEPREASASSEEPPSAPEAPEIFWVRTGVSTVEARGTEVVQRLLELGVIRPEHGIGTSAQGPFVPLAEHPRFGQGLSRAERRPPLDALDEEAPIVASSPAPRQGRIGTSTGGDVSVVIALSEEEIEYLQDEVSQKRAIGALVDRRLAASGEGRGEVSNIIVLSGADLEIVEDDPLLLSADLVVEVGPAQVVSDDALELAEEDVEELDEPPAAGRAGEAEIIELGVDDIEEFEHIATGAGLPALESSWEEFCRAMNLAAQRVATRGATQESTWDLFRSMMERPRVTPGGPSEASWNRFQDRLQGRRTGRTPLPTETTWDRFRELMTAPTQASETTWSRFVRGIQKSRTGPARRGRDLVRAAGVAIAGEARIKSDIVRISDLSGPKVRVDGLKGSTSDE